MPLTRYVCVCVRVIIFIFTLQLLSAASATAALAHRSSAGISVYSGAHTLFHVHLSVFLTLITRTMRGASSFTSSLLSLSNLPACQPASLTTHTA